MGGREIGPSQNTAAKHRGEYFYCRMGGWEDGERGRKREWEGRVIEVNVNVEEYFSYRERGEEVLGGGGWKEIRL